MDKKIVFFDIDGTLLDHDKKLPESTKQAVNQLKEKGYEVAIATGRAPFMFKELRDELGIDTYISFNGQYIVLNGEVLYQNPLDVQELQALTAFAAQKNHPVVYLDHDDMRSNIEFHEHIEASISTLKLGIIHPIHDPLYYENREIYQALLFCTDGEEKPYEEKFKKFDYIRWHEFSTDVLPAGGSKAKGIEVMINKLGYKKENVYAFGDGLNDIEMLSYVGNGVAMGNAHDEVKEVANYITKDVADNGIAHGLQLVGLLS
ncbi:Cof-type HAD-IIB family hydrolase [Priestia flexa]|uniref:Cof-type HAD-IIB family hydrolase n=1 Tax=Priestia flexa TaxID=86664 RepID=A0ABU4J2L3_9BACI|nr:Cof-type HAD-IIB family hydrolase [Priestia flexa]MDW8515224.1 Cof-type HAD-IIB family hydrolase [Priestia flexa]